MTDILGELRRERVVEFTINKDCTLVSVKECCDNYYSLDLNKDQLYYLIQELNDIYGCMIGGGKPHTIE